MGLSEELEEKGWFLSPEGIQLCTGDINNPKPADIIKQVYTEGYNSR